MLNRNCGVFFDAKKARRRQIDRPQSGSSVGDHPGKRRDPDRFPAMAPVCRSDLQVLNDGAVAIARRDVVKCDGGHSELSQSMPCLTQGEVKWALG